MVGEQVNEQGFVQVLALRLDPAWRRLTDDVRERDLAEFARAAGSAGRDVLTETYSLVGLRSDADLVLMRMAPSLERLEETAALLLRSGVGRWMSVARSFVGLVRPSRYVRKPGAQEQAITSGERAAYLVVYPFTKTHDWYRLSKDARQGMMNEHIRIGHEFPQVRQLLASSTGLDDQEFIVAYETEDLAAFQDLVIALRESVESTTFRL
ncbi:MAG: chlorite dismutase family protein [Armatimonadetes bacterium]|nr:chlorite dismutase family protein [Armatimonadota bacterium]